MGSSAELEELLAMLQWDEVILRAMHYERWAFDFVDFLDVAEDVKGCRKKKKSRM